ncbi:MAG: HAD family hydrolase [Gemmatimonadales bacterium]|nr:HAD family hydrolase [Gemmatimonadales bacterium]
MRETGKETKFDEAMGRILLWDLAGTLLIHDEITHRTGPLPGWEDSLPGLARDFRMVVATGEESNSAGYWLEDYGLLPFFEEVFGGLLSHGGKPHGEILHQLGGQPKLSLVIGDRLRGDIPTDCDDLVTLLVNQDGKILDAGLIAETVRFLQQAAPTMPEAFRKLAARSEPDPESLGNRSDGMVTAAWRSKELSGARLWIFEPDWLETPRAVIVI